MFEIRKPGLGPGINKRLLGNLVHEEWYQKYYPDIGLKKIDPVDHYIKSGFAENRIPNPFFIPAFYLSYHADLHGYDFPAGTHYLVHGVNEERRPSPLVNTRVYNAFYKDERFETQSKTISEDFLNSDDRSLSFPFFDLDWYREQAAKKSVRIPEDYSFNQTLMHFLTHGLDKGVSPHPLIELDFIEGYSAFAQKFDAFCNLFTAESERGTTEISQYVEGEFFVAKSGPKSVHPVIHYLFHPDDDSLWLNPLFDSEFYRKTYQLDDDAECLSHFVKEGEAAGNWPNAYFDTARYRSFYENTFESGESVIHHYNRMGHMVWFEPSDKFGQRYYYRNNPDVVAAGHPLLTNFLHDDSNARRATPPKPYFDDTVTLSDEEMVQEIIELDQQADMDSPVVDVIIPVYQNLRYTLRCLLSCYRNRDGVSFRAWIADDASPDGSGEWLKAAFQSKLKYTTVIVNEENLGFLKSCNSASGQGDAEFVYFLNNDTYVLDGYLSTLLKVFEDEKNVGLAGSKLVYPNGLLQEAGGIIWSDGSSGNYGRMDDPNAPEFNFVREVDYISGASIMLRRTDWEAVGRFSEDLAPAYYEDTDVAMKIREIGKRVIYQPASRVVHYEGVSSGTDLTSGIKKYQVINAGKFLKKWQVPLAQFGETGDLSPEVVNRYSSKRILIIDEELPKPDQDSGSITAYYYMKILRDLGYEVTFLPKNLELQGKYAAPLQQLGVLVLFYPYVRSIEDYLDREGDSYDLFMLSRINSGAEYLKKLKRDYPGTPVIFDTVDLHHLRLRRQFEHSGDVEVARRAYEEKQKELNAVQTSDLTLLVSEFEKQYLTREIGPFPVEIIPLIYEEIEEVAPFKERADFAFVGGFRHTPNLDAVDYLVNQIWPEYLKRGGTGKLYIIGSHMPAEIKEIDQEGVISVGFVEDLESFLSGVKATLAPLRYGAGVKGKVGNSLRQGVPVVASQIAAEGMGLKYDEEILVSDIVPEFVEHMLKVETDEAVWNALSTSGREAANRKFGYQAAKKKLSRIVKTLIDQSEL